MRFNDFVFVYHLRDERQIAWHGRLHNHGDGLYELHYFISGEGSFRDRSLFFPIRPGSLYITPPGATHQLAAMSARKPVTYYALLLDTEEDDEVLGLLEGLERRCGSLTIGFSQRFFFADLLVKAGSGSPELVKAAHHNLLAFLYGLAASPTVVRRETDNTYIEKAIAIMQGSVESNLELGAICDRIHLSREHFVRFFSERMGMPPMRYYRRLKIEAAQAMLSSTSLRVQEISAKLGYVNQFVFAHAFKRISGKSPSQYRAIYLQRANFAEGSPWKPR